MNLILIIVFLGIVFFLFAVPNNQEKNSESELRPYVSKNPLTATETDFYHRLIEALPEYIVLAQVQLSSFLKIDRSLTNGRNHNKWFNPIAQQSVDYLICTKNFLIVAAIELDDKTHDSDDATKRDYKKTSNLAAAKVPLIRWHAESMPEVETIKQAFLKHTSSSANSTTSQPEWLADGQQAFFNRAKNQANSTLPQVLFFAVILIAIIMWGKSQISGLINNPKAPDLQQSNAQKVQLNPVNPYQALLEKQQQDQALQAEIKKQNDLSQQLLIQQKGNQKLLQLDEETRKQEMWDRDYKKSVVCGDTENAVTCGNRYIKARQKFDQNWEAEKSK